jgi:hypothetical protein
VDDITKNMSAGKQTDILIMDFSKAFDKVSHNLLLHKLEYYGIRGNINRWIASFLYNHTQAVVVDGESSTHIDVVRSTTRIRTWDIIISALHQRHA